MVYGLLLLGIAIGFFYQAYVSKVLAKALIQPSESKENAGIIADRWIRKNGWENVQLAVTEEKAADHYQPQTGILVLSEKTILSNSIGAIAIIAHEMGHVMQHHEGNVLMRIHSIMTPAMNACSAFSWVILAVGIIMNWSTARSVGMMMIICTMIYAGMIFILEKDAGKKGLNLIREDRVLTDTETRAAHRLLRITSASYPVSALSNSIHMLWLVITEIIGIRSH